MPLTQTSLLALALIISTLTINKANADTEQTTANPAKFAFGIGATYSQLPDYLGSTVTQHYLLPFPYVVYQSDKIKVNQTEALGQLFKANDWSINLSFAGALPVNSENNPYRKEMPDLHWIAEIGTTLDHKIYQTPSNELTLRIALRKAVATNLQDWQSVGWRFEPHLRWRKSLNNKIQVNSQLSAIWSTAQYHQYLYGVEQQYVNLQRSQYQADGGFSGWRLSSGISWRHRQWWLGSFIRYDNLQQATYRDSPLVQRQHNISLAIAFAWIFNQQGVIYEN